LFILGPPQKEAFMRTLEEARFYGYDLPVQVRSETKVRLADEFHVAPRGLMGLLRALERETRALERARAKARQKVMAR
jgi:hypothetical protein